MKIHRIAGALRRAVFAGFLINSILPVFADDILPIITVQPPSPPLSYLISNLQVLEEEDLSVAHERSIADVIQGFPGISSTKPGGYGQATGLFIRGAGGQGLITLDDIPLLLTLPGLHNLDALPIESIQTAEIERGSGAVHYAFQPLGGSIRLYTRDRQDTGAVIVKITVASIVKLSGFFQSQPI